MQLKCTVCKEEFEYNDILKALREGRHDKFDMVYECYKCGPFLSSEQTPHGDMCPICSEGINYLYLIHRTAKHVGELA